MDDRLPEFEAGPDDQPTAVEVERRGDGRLIVRIRGTALCRPTARLIEWLTDALSDPEVRAAIQQAVSQHRQSL